jgi:hypothetical protein
VRGPCVNIVSFASFCLPRGPSGEPEPSVPEPLSFEASNLTNRGTLGYPGVMSKALWVIPLLVTLLFSSEGIAQDEPQNGPCACRATTSGSAPLHLAANWFVSGTFTNLVDLNGQCQFLPACPAAPRPCAHSWLMDFTVTVLSGSGPLVEAGISVNFGLPFFVPLGFTGFIPPNSFQFQHAPTVHQACGNNIGGQYRFTEGPVSIMSGFVFMLCEGC